MYEHKTEEKKRKKPCSYNFSWQGF